MKRGEFRHTGFFTLRTPLLPLEFLQAWSKMAEHDGADNHAFLAGAFDAPDLRDALFVASPAIEEALQRDGTTTDPVKRRRLDAGLTKYLMRMAGRSTPFGLFAGVSLGTFGSRSELRLAPRSEYRRFTRIDMGYLASLVDRLTKEPAVRNAIHYRPNSTLYSIGGRARYVERRPGRQRSRSYFLVSADVDDGLRTVLELAAPGVTRETLACALARDGIEKGEALAYIDELIDGQVLEPDLALAMTGCDPMRDLEEQLAGVPGLEGLAGKLASLRDKLQTLDAEGVGAAPQRYRDVATAVSELPTEASIDRLFQVDMVKPAETLTLSESLLDEVAHVGALLERMFGGDPGDPFENFRRAFSDRWGDRSVPLLQTLDEDCGIGFRTITSEASPLLAGLVFPPAQETESRVPWGPTEVLLLRRLTETRADPDEALVITDEDAARLPDRPVTLPNAYSVMLTLLSVREEEAPCFLWRGLAGPSGARLLGRFCHADPELLGGVQGHLRAEEALDPEKLFCEIVHLPEGRVGNVIARPLLRDHDIVFLARSGAPQERQIPLSDLRVSVRGDRVVLRSERLGREIVPRLTNAHNFSKGIGVYLFLAMLQNQDTTSGLAWHWGPFESLPFLPRVTYRKHILASARWMTPTSEIQAGDGAADPVRFSEWADARRLPRWVGLKDGDNVLPADRLNRSSLDALVDAIDTRSQYFTLMELPWLDGPGVVQGPEGTFANEIVIPLVRHAPVSRTAEFAADEREETSLDGVATRLLPGSEWLFARLDTAPGFADALLVESLGPLVEELRNEGIVKDWFFIRYSDPDFHIRLRFRGSPSSLAAQVLPRLHAMASDQLHLGLVTKVLYDSYDREVQRYGGPNGIDLCERMFGVDSDAVLDLIASTLGDEGGVARWQLALCGMDSLLRDAGFDLEQRHSFARRMADSYGREFRLQGPARHPIQDKLRKERRTLLTLLDGSRDEPSPLEPGLQVLRRRTEAMAPLLSELRQRGERGELASAFTDIVSSLIHMHVNRMVPTAARAQEAILYRFLENLCESQLARIRN